MHICILINVCVPDDTNYGINIYYLQEIVSSNFDESTEMIELAINYYVPHELMNTCVSTGKHDNPFLFFMSIPDIPSGGQARMIYYMGFSRVVSDVAAMRDKLNRHVCKIILILYTSAY